jgi:hypothetical protein
MVTIAVSFTVVACQPTMAREKQSITNPTRTKSDHVLQ